MKKKSLSDAPLVWSSESGRICPECSRPVSQCTCRRRGGEPATDGIVRVRRETKGRGGKTVTVISGISGEAAKSIGGELKRICGTGGTVKEGVIEIQGDHRDLVVTNLEKRGFIVKRAGG